MSEFNKQETVDEQEMSNSIAVTNHNQMGADEARKLTSDILTNEQNSKRALYRIGVEKGYLAMGYKDFKSYVVSELRITPNAAGKQFAAACAAAALFGENYIGVYSDASMRLLSAFNLPTQVMAIQYLQQSSGKQNYELPSSKELTTNAIKDAVAKTSKRGKELLQNAQRDLDPEDFDDNHTDYCVECMAIYEPYDEKEYVDKYGFSRWDARSINLFKKDELIKFKSRDELETELSFNWSLYAISEHMKIYFPDRFSEFQRIINFHPYPHSAGILLLLEEYFSSSSLQGSPNESDDFHIEEQEDEVDYCSVDELMEDKFFADADSPSLEHEYSNGLKMLKRQIAKKLNEELKRKNPKAGYLIAVSESMNAEELDLARCFFELKYNEQTKNEESDCVDAQSDDFDFGN